ncbi:MAG: zinc ribbon domain-containing protein [Candidatus Hodarchaeota archaeon]
MSEDVYFYLDLTKELLKKKEIIKTIKYYIEEKNKSNLKGNYSLLIFQQEGNPIFLTDKKDFEIIANSIEENWNNRPKGQSFFENGLFYIFSYIAETVRKKSKFNRIIVVTDTPSDLSAEYQEALFNLVSKIKNFPTFIDIIRVTKQGERFFKDDVKLNVLASDTKGGIFYIQDRKGFFDVIKKLVKTKQFVTTFTDKSELVRISKEDYAFFNNLAKSVVKSSELSLVCHFCNDEVCPVCTDVHDVPNICEDCNTAFHNCCLTNYTINNNIGIPNILRCPSCDVLLKIPEDEIIGLSEEIEGESVKDYMEKEFLQDLAEEVPEGQEVVLEIPPEPKVKAPKKVAKTVSPVESTKTIRIGGFFGKVFTVKKVGDKIVYERATKSPIKPTSEARKRDEIILKDAIPLTDKKSIKKPSFIICPQCGTQNTSQQTSCSNCGYKL